ncbi:MAG TPA: DUF5961 family protein [Caulobacteraceae bacterium]|jgi:hypothetical protein|nr:DUF5961 family protein [Caulobacteraceae bacterium]
MSDVVVLRRFSVHGRHEERHHAKLVMEHSFEAAAVAYLENAHASGEPEISVIVLDVESGHQHCFRIDVETGETTPCG